MRQLNNKCEVSLLTFTQNWTNSTKQIGQTPTKAKTRGNDSKEKERVIKLCTCALGHRPKGEFSDGVCDGMALFYSSIYKRLLCHLISSVLGKNGMNFSTFLKLVIQIQVK